MQITAPVPIFVFRCAAPAEMLSASGSFSIGFSTLKFFAASFGAEFFDLYRRNDTILINDKVDLLLVAVTVEIQRRLRFSLIEVALVDLRYPHVSKNAPSIAPRSNVSALVHLVRCAQSSVSRKYILGALITRFKALLE